MNEQALLFHFEGDRIETMLFSEESFRFLNKKIYSISEFNSQFDKKFTTVIATQIKLKNIKSIAYEKDSCNVKIKYKTFGFLPSDQELKFDSRQDLEYFFELIVNLNNFKKVEKYLNVFQANYRYFLGLAMDIFGTLVFYSMALDIENGVEPKSSRASEFILKFIIKFLGKYGVLLLGATIAFYILKNIWKRIKNSPFQIKYLPHSSR